MVRVHISTFDIPAATASFPGSLSLSQHEFCTRSVARPTSRPIYMYNTQHVLCDVGRASNHVRNYNRPSHSILLIDSKAVHTVQREGLETRLRPAHGLSYMIFYVHVYLEANHHLYHDCEITR